MMFTRHRARKGWLAVLAAFLCCVLAGCGANFGTTADGKQRYRWKMTITVGATSTWYKAAKRFADDLDAQTHGRITVKVFPNEQLSAGEATAGVEQLMDGAKDLSFNSPIIYAAVNPKYGAVAAPFAFSSVDEGRKALEGEGGELYRKLLADDGVELLDFGESGMRQLTNSHHPIQAPKDMAGMKFRIPAFGLYTDFYRAVGANPTTMPFSEVFTALQQGAIDGQENPIDVIYTSDLQAVQPYLSIWNYSYDPLILGMNKKLYDSLSDEDRQIVGAAATKASNSQVEENRKLEAGELKELREDGMNVDELSDEQITGFKKSLKPLYKKYRSVWGPQLSDHFIPKGY